MKRENISLEEIKKREVQLLLKFAKYCDENNLRYVLCGGTLLGAIRHKGFIPWDDDIDIMLPRPDYQKFLQLQKKEKSFIYRTISDDSIDYPFMKIIDPKVMIDMTYDRSKEPEYLWIDVFPMDGLPKDDKENRKIFKKSLTLRKMLMISRAKMGKGTTGFRKIVKIPLHIIFSLIGSNKLAHRIDNLCQTYSFENSEYVGGLAWGYGKQERMNKKLCMDRIKVVFEGNEFWAPGCWDYYLTQLYGDYMKLPPKEEQRPHNRIAWKV